MFALDLSLGSVCLRLGSFEGILFRDKSYVYYRLLRIRELARSTAEVSRAAR